MTHEENLGFQSLKTELQIFEHRDPVQMKKDKEKCNRKAHMYTHMHMIEHFGWWNKTALSTESHIGPCAGCEAFQRCGSVPVGNTICIRERRSSHTLSRAWAWSCLLLSNLTVKQSWLLRFIHFDEWVTFLKRLRSPNNANPCWTHEFI